MTQDFSEDHKLLLFAMLDALVFLDARGLLKHRWTYLLQEAVHGAVKASVNLAIDNDMDHNQHEEPRPAFRVVGVHITSRRQGLLSVYSGSVSIGNKMVRIVDLPMKTIKRAATTRTIPDGAYCDTLRVQMDRAYDPNRDPGRDRGQAI